MLSCLDSKCFNALAFVEEKFPERFGRVDVIENRFATLLLAWESDRIPAHTKSYDPYTTPFPTAEPNIRPGRLESSRT